MITHRSCLALLIGVGILNLPQLSKAQERPFSPAAIEWIEESIGQLPPQEGTPSDHVQWLFEHLCEAFGCVGASIAVASKGKVIFSTGVGMANLEHAVPAGQNTVYNIGSVSKVLTATAVLQLVERGLVSLDDDVREYVPEFPEKDILSRSAT